MNLYDLTVQMLGTPPNEVIESLYYVLDVFIVIMVFKIVLLLFQRGLRVKI